MRALLLIVCAWGCYGPAYKDCEVGCASGNGCPSGLTCDLVLHACRLPGAGPTCGSTGGDSMMGGDVGADGPIGMCEAAQVVATGAHTCARRGDGTVWCWGTNSSGELGSMTGLNCPPSPLPCNPTPTQVQLTKKVVDIGLSDRNSCAEDEGGAVWCWGDNSSFQFGDGTQQGGPTPKQNPLRMAPDQIVGGNTFLASRHGTMVLCSGANSRGECGVGSTSTVPQARAVQAPGFTPSFIAAGDEHMCAIDASQGGSVWCWGDNSSQQTLPFDGRVVVLSPQPLDATMTGVVAVAAGHRHTCILTTATVHCTGDNNFGQLGRGAVGTGLPGYQAVANLPMTIKDIAAGGNHTCALDGTGRRVYCWGDEGNGQPNGTPREVLMPTGRFPLSITAGAQHACAILDDRSVWCWGSNQQGQLGDGTVGPLSAGTKTKLCP